MEPNNKRNFGNSVPLCQSFNVGDHEPLWKIAHKNMNNSSKMKEDYQFKVGCMSYLNLK